MHGVLPLKAILFGRHIGTSGVCPICDQEEENVLHMVFKCQGAVNIWRALGFEHMISDAMEPGRSGSQVLEVLLKTPSSTVAGYDSIKVQETIATAAWYIWWLHRRQTFGELVPPVNVCSNSIRSIVANAARTKTQGSMHKKMWIKPRAGFLKLNVDASFSAESHSGATGAIIRDGRGDFIAASSTFIPHVGAPQMAEAIAMLHGLRLANDKGCNNIEAESDS
jgi:hypothetical protein